MLFFPSTLISHMRMCMCTFCKPQFWQCSVVFLWHQCVLRMSPLLSCANAIKVLQCASLQLLHNLPCAAQFTSEVVDVPWSVEFLLLSFVLFFCKGVLKRTSCSSVCKSTGMDVKTRPLATPSCLHGPLVLSQLPPQHLTPCQGHRP